MLYDAMFEFLDDGELIATSTTDYNAATAKELDWVTADLDIGQGTPIYLNITVGTTAYVGGTSMDFKLFADAVSSGHDSNSTYIMSSGPILIANLTAGAFVMSQALPVNCDPERYLQIAGTADGTVSSGTINAWLSNAPMGSVSDTQVDESNI